MDLDRSSVSRTLAAAGCISPDTEADELIAAADGDGAVLSDLVSRRSEGEPVAWLVGSVRFCDERVTVSPGVYVPRRQTEPLVRRAAALLPDEGLAADLCTGSGAIAVVLRASVPSARVVATELDVAALTCARANGVEVFPGYLDDPLPSALEHRVDVMTAVVPYVPTDAMRFLPRDVQTYEPRLALDGGSEGTDLLNEVVRRAPRWLRPGGWLFLELGGDQAESIARLTRDRGFEMPEVLIDDEGDPRGICARLT
jgi:release factor glutamine methyltransferase